jgi:hypothetical protein
LFQKQVLLQGTVLGETMKTSTRIDCHKPRFEPCASGTQIQSLPILLGLTHDETMAARTRFTHFSAWVPFVETRAEFTDVYLLTSSSAQLYEDINVRAFRRHYHTLNDTLIAFL